MNNFPTQLELAPQPPAQRHSPTSVGAAKSIEPSAGTLRNKVWSYLCGCGSYGATDEELQDALEINPSTQRPRRIELVKLGRVVDSGQTRLTRSGRSAVVWRVK